jgi:hypothetical protein
VKEGVLMADFIVNKAGAKIYMDTSKHEVLEVPVLQDEKETGVVYDVLSVGVVGLQREPIVTVKESNGQVVAYRLPHDLLEWVEYSIGMKLQGLSALPAKIEFGKLNNRMYAEIL